MESVRHTVTLEFLAKFMEGPTEQNRQTLLDKFMEGPTKQNRQTLDEESKMLQL